MNSFEALCYTSPVSSIKKEDWLTCNRLNNNCLLHDFFNGDVDAIPSLEIIAEGLLLPNKYGDTPLHHAAQKDIEMVPQELLTKKNLTTKNKDGVTPLHDAAQSGEIQFIPKELLNEEVLTMQDNDGETPLYHANENCNLDYLLGIEFSDAIVDEVGQEWFDRNNEVLARKMELVQDEVEVPTIDLF